MSKKYIGGGDIAAVVGLDKYRTNVDVWLAKYMMVKPEPNVYMDAGLLLEPYVCNRFAREHGFNLIDLEGDEKFKLHPKYDFLMGVADRLIVEPDGNSILEVKTTRLELNEPQDSWVLQANWYMEIHNLQTAIVAWLQLPNTFDYVKFCNTYTVDSDLSFLDTVTKLQFKVFERNQELIDRCIVEAVSFWSNHVLTGTPPEPKTAMDVIKLYPIQTKGKSINVNRSIYSDYLRIKDLGSQIKYLSEEKDRLNESIKVLMKDAETAVYDGKLLFTFTAYEKQNFKSDLFTNYCSDNAIDNKQFFETSKIRTLRSK